MFQCVRRSFVFGWALVAGVGVCATHTDTTIAPPPRQAGRPPIITVTSTTRPAVMIPSFVGGVTAVDRESITVQGMDIGVGGRHQFECLDGRRGVHTHIGWPLRVEGWGWTARPIRYIYSGVDRRPEVELTFWDGRREVYREADEPHRRFLVGFDLAAGEWLDTAQPADSYRLADVRVGDRIRLEIRNTIGSPGPPLYNYCVAISITRRPGGKVPPAPGQDPNEPLQYHERMQAHQDWEEKGTPFPYKYCPDWGVQLAPPPRLAQPKLKP